MSHKNIGNFSSWEQTSEKSILEVRPNLCKIYNIIIFNLRKHYMHACKPLWLS